MNTTSPSMSFILYHILCAISRKYGWPLKINDILFVWGFSSKNFHSSGNATITGDGLQILTYTRHIWQLNCEGSLTCHIYCDTGHTFIYTLAPRIRDNHTYCRAFGSGAVSTCFNDLGLLRPEFEHSTFRMQGERFNWLRHIVPANWLNGDLCIFVFFPAFIVYHACICHINNLSLRKGIQDGRQLKWVGETAVRTKRCNRRI